MRYAVAIVAIGLAVAVPAASQGAPSAKAQEKAAKKACAAGDFRKGVDILADLYVETDNLVHIFNQGRCYEQNHQWAGAIDRFREYLRKNTKASAAERAEAEKHIADCESFRQQEEVKLAPPAVVAPAPAPAPVAPIVVVTSPEPKPTDVVERAATPAENPGSGLRVTGIVLGSVGLAAVATGLVLNLKANSLGDDYNKNQNPDTKSSYNSYKTGSLIGYAAGGGLLVTGLILYLVGQSSGTSTQASQTALLPSVSSSQVSLALLRSF